MVDSIDTIRISDFIMSLVSETDNDIIDLKNQALANNVPIIRDETKQFLRMLLNIYKPSQILEIGTAVAYSTLVMHRTCKDAQIVTVENYKKRIEEAKKNIDTYFDKDKIKLIESDAGEYLKNIKDIEFDFIFLDAAKGQYINWITDIKRLLHKGSILVSDNIFKDGEVIESKFLIKKRDRTIHKRMREFLNYISKDKDFETYIFNIGDGISVSIKK